MHHQGGSMDLEVLCSLEGLSGAMVIRLITLVVRHEQGHQKLWISNRCEEGMSATTTPRIAVVNYAIERGYDMAQ